MRAQDDMFHKKHRSFIEFLVKRPREVKNIEFYFLDFDYDFVFVTIILFFKYPRKL